MAALEWVPLAQRTGWLCRDDQPGAGGETHAPRKAFVPSRRGRGEELVLCPRIGPASVPAAGAACAPLPAPCLSPFPWAGGGCPLRTPRSFPTPLPRGGCPEAQMKAPLGPPAGFASHVLSCAFLSLPPSSPRGSPAAAIRGRLVAEGDLRHFPPPPPPPRLKIARDLFSGRMESPRGRKRGSRQASASQGEGGWAREGERDGKGRK